MISLDALDDFAKQHLQFEVQCARRLCTPSNEPHTDADVVAALHRIRGLIMKGFVDEALNVSDSLCSEALQDPAVQLNVRIHKLFELIHVTQNVPGDDTGQYSEAVGEALRYSQELASFSLHASPEAYGLFTEAMMLFAFPDETVSPESLQHRRKLLADDVVSLLRFTTGAKESFLSFLLRYLLLICVQFDSAAGERGERDPVHSIIQELLALDSGPEGKSGGVLWETEGRSCSKFGHRGEYSEADVQALRERVSITRQESIESLRFTEGDSFAALRNELGRLRVRRGLLRRLVLEYCASRGLDIFETAKEAPSDPHEDEFAELSNDLERVKVSEATFSHPVHCMFGTMRDLRRVATQVSSHGASSVWEEVNKIVPERSLHLDFRLRQCQVLHHLLQDECLQALDRLQTHMGPLAKESTELLPILTDTLVLLVFVDDLKNMEDGRQCPAEIIARGRSETSEAQRVSPGQEQVAAQHSGEPGNDGQKAAVSNFNDYFSKAYERVLMNASIESIIRQAYEHLERKYGEPTLVSLLRHLLRIHEDWQTQNMMKDQFCAKLGIPEIRGEATPFGSVLSGGVDTNEKNNALGGRTEEQSHSQGSPEDQREQTILKLMEFLAMSRAEALTVVRNHPHATNAQAIIESVLGGMT